MTGLILTDFKMHISFWLFDLWYTTYKDYINMDIIFLHSLEER